MCTTSKRRPRRSPFRALAGNDDDAALMIASSERAVLTMKLHTWLAGNFPFTTRAEEFIAGAPMLTYLSTAVAVGRATTTTRTTANDSCKGWHQPPPERLRPMAAHMRELGSSTAGPFAPLWSASGRGQCHPHSVPYPPQPPPDRSFNAPAPPRRRRNLPWRPCNM